MNHLCQVAGWKEATDVADCDNDTAAVGTNHLASDFGVKLLQLPDAEPRQRVLRAMPTKDRYTKRIRISSHRGSHQPLQPKHRRSRGVDTAQMRCWDSRCGGLPSSAPSCSALLFWSTELAAKRWYARRRIINTSARRLPNKHPTWSEWNWTANVSFRIATSWNIDTPPAASARSRARHPSFCPG